MSLPMRVCLFLLALIGASSIAGRSSAPAYAPEITAARLDEINKKIAALNLKSRTEETYYERGMRIRKFIKQGNFATARSIITETLGSSRMRAWAFYPATYVIYGIVDVNDPELEEKMNDWVKRAPDDPIALLVRAQLYLEIGSARRGEQVAAKTSRKQFNGFSDYMSMARADIETSIKLDSTNPLAYDLKLSIISAPGFSAELAKAFADAIAKFPDDYRLYDIVLTRLNPKWGGSIKAMKGFVNLYAGAAPESSPLKMLYLALYGQLMDAAAFMACPDRNDQDAKVRCVTKEMDDYVTPEVQTGVRDALQLYDKSDPVEFGIVVENPLRDMLRIYGGKPLVRALLEKVAAAMHSETGPFYGRSRPPHQHYMTDILVSEAQRRDGALALAIRSQNDALQDIDNLKFTSPAEKYQEISRIYVRMAYYSDKAGNIPDTVAYETAALAMDKAATYGDLACEGYAKLHIAEEAIRSCTEALERSNTFNARFWRGTAYRDLGEWENSLKDLIPVADSDDAQQIFAAIGIAMVYSFKEDHRSELATYDKPISA